MTAIREALLASAVDYAGLFPPAQLPMATAVARYSEYRRSADAWMLGSFVLSSARLAEFAASAGRVATRGETWSLSVVAGDAESAVSLIADFNAAYTWAKADTLEVKASSPEEVRRIADASRKSPLRVFVEVPIAGDPNDIIAAIAAYGLGAKVRTGGIVASAFPQPAHVVRFLDRCMASGVQFKATAGLHHLIRGEYRLTYEPDSATATMYGYLNVFLAAALLRAGFPADDALAMLEERDVSTIRFDDTGVHWRGRVVGAEVVVALRQKGLAGFGSCSFSEPTEELHASEAAA